MKVADPELLVIGAGPAGTAAAITAARAGRRVTIVDRAAFPRDKTCGDGLTTEALRRLEDLGVPLADLAATAAPVTEARLVAPSGRHVLLPLPTDGEHVRVIRRMDLDQRLVDLARASGAQVVEGAEMVAVTTHDTDGVQATLADGRTLTAPFAIAADGHYSTTRRLLLPHLPPNHGEWIAFRQYFSGVDDARLWVLFERDLLPGYAWVFPLPDGRANVGFAMVREPGLTGKVLARRWCDLLERPVVSDILGPRAEPEAAHRAWPIPTRLRPDRLSVGRVLFVGDAAGVADPMTGEGIAQALWTGTLAAQIALGPAAGAPSISGSRPPAVATTPAVVAARYRQAVRTEIGRDLRLAGILQRVLAHPVGAEGALRLADLTAWTRRNFARWMFEDYPRAILATPRRWHAGMLAPPGAYRPA